MMKDDYAELTTEDRALAKAIAEAETPHERAAAAWHYYHRDGSDRTPRSLMILHIGMLVGEIEKMIHASTDAETAALVTHFRALSPVWREQVVRGVELMVRLEAER